MNIIELLEQKGKITIPSIQRDYAYGRESEKAIAKGLVDSVFEVLTDKEGKKKLRLNYIYGVPKSVDKEDQIRLIDGQQRTTTLFLIGLYLCANAGDAEKEQFNSNNFCYETRTTTKDFCAFLCTESRIILQCNDQPVKEKIINNKKFFKRWLNDPTIYSMLTVLDMIDKKCKKGNRDFKRWIENLKNVTFDYISLDSFKREESLYSTMNGRGKQLTEFEQIKSDIFELFRNLDKNIENTVNNIWIPAFWDYAKKGQDDQYAANNHDRFLYNYFKYVVTMAYWENNDVGEKDNKTPDLKEMIKKLKDNTKALDTILFSMKHFSDFWKVDFEKYLANKNVQDPDNPLKVNIFWDFDFNDFNLIGQCCNNVKFANIERCLLWAYIIYKYKNKTEDENIRRDYFVLIRDVYAAWWDSNTPTGTEKTPKEHQVAAGIRAFRQIVDDGVDPINGRYKIQEETFKAKNEEKYRILNNKCTRGCSNNIAKIVKQDGCSQEQAIKFAENLDFLLNNATSNNEARFGNLMALEAIGYPYFICYNNSDKRLYLPFNQNMLQSFFSMGQWKASDEPSDEYNKSIEALTKKSLQEELKEKKIEYGVSDWQDYIYKYSDCFMYEKSFCGFDFDKSDKDTPKFYSLIGVYGTRATAKQSVSPYILAAYIKAKHPTDQIINKNMIEECIKEKENKGIKIIEEDGCVYVVSDTVTKENGKWDKSEDFVLFIMKYFKQIQ